MTRRNDTQWFQGDDRFIELMHALTHPDEHWSQPDRPDMLLSLDELIAWTNDTRAYDERMHESGWRSVINDFLAAANSLGSKTSQVVQAHVHAIRNASQPGVGGDQALRAQLAIEAAAMCRTLATTETLEAAWADLIGVINRTESPMNTISSRRDSFWAVVRATDRNAFELSKQLTSVLTGDPFEALRAKLELGEIDKIDGTMQSIRSTTPFTDPKERLKLAVKILGAEPTSRSHIVWFAFRRASLTSIGQTFGCIRLFEAQWIRANLLSDQPLSDEVPSELSGLDDDANTIPDQRDVVMASVDLGRGTFSDAVRVASERLDAFVGMSTIGSPVPWERLPGFIHVEDGRIVAYPYFMHEEQNFQFTYALTGTAGQLASMAPRVAPMIPVHDQGMKDVIGALHWWRGGPDQPAAASIVLNVRIIDLVASRIGETSWTTYVEKYTKNPWIHDAIMTTLYLPLHEALTRHVPPDVYETQRAIFLDATQYKDGQQRFLIGKAARHLDTIIQFTPASLPLGRDLRTIKQRTSSVAAVQAWCAELERLWNGWVHRLERIRNSIAHGGPFTEQVVILAQPFSQRIAVWSLWESVEGFLDGKTLPQSHAALKDRWDQWRLSAQRATSVGEIIDVK